MKQDNEIDDTRAPSEPADEAGRRREKMLAFYLDALTSEETALIQGRLSNNPEWQAAANEAQAMLNGFKQDGPQDCALPEGLAEKTLKRLRESQREAPAAQKTVLKTAPRAIPKSFFTPRMAAAIFLACLLPMGYTAARYYWPAGQVASILWRADSELASGAPYSPFMQVRDALTQQPVARAKVVAYLKGPAAPRRLIGEGETDDTGTFAGSPWKIPDVEAGQYNLEIELHSSTGAVLDRAQRGVKVARSANLALAADRSQARPGETIRARTLFVAGADAKPVAGKKVVIELLDPVGNRIARNEKDSTQFGLAWAEFPLDSAAIEGSYLLRAEADGLKSEQRVEVKQYVLPPYKVTITPDRAWFKAADRVTGKIEARTFDGHAVGGAKGVLLMSDASGSVAVRSQITLDAEGRASFDLNTGSAVAFGDKKVLPLRMSAELTDAAGREARGQALTSLSQVPLLLTAVAEGGDLVPGVENRVFVIARAPDGTPVRGRLRVVRDGREEFSNTDDQGVAVLKLSNPRDPAEVLQVSVENNSYSQNLSLPVRLGSRGRLLVRTDKAVIASGNSVKVSVLSGDPALHSAATIALRQNGRTVVSRGVMVKDGLGELAIEIPPEVSGVLSIDASVPSNAGALWTDSRVVAVVGKGGLQVAAAPDRAQYRPGEHAKLNFTVTNKDGRGVPAAVSLVAVDEALLAMTGDNPGLAQALLAAGFDALKAAGVPANSAPEAGSSPAVLAAYAGLKPTVALNPESVVDSTWAKRQQIEARKRELGNLLGSLAWSAVLIGIAFLIFLWAAKSSERDWDDALQAVRNAVPILTAAAGVAGILITSMIDLRRSEFFALTFAGTLIGGHAMILLREWCFRGGTCTFARVLGILFSDVVLLVLASAWLSPFEHQIPGILVAMAGVLVFSGIQYLLTIPFLEGASPGSLMFTGGACTLLAILTVSTLGNKVAEVVGTLAVILPGAQTTDDHKIHSAQLIEFEDEPSANYKYDSKQAPGFSHEGPGDPSIAIPESVPQPAAVPPRLRFDFPETMIFAPQIITGEDGRASFELDVTDSLTRWLVQTDAVAASGGTAWTSANLVVTQPFSVDLKLPADVTSGDVLYVPAVVSNHTDKEKSVDVTLDVSGANVLDGEKRTLVVGAKSVAAAEFVIKFDQSGSARLRVNANAGDDRDSSERTLNVLPDGKPVAFAASGYVSGNGELELTVPETALPGTISTSLRIHRGPLTQMIDGLESMLQEPHGCFEQTSSTTYPNVMILRYLKANGVNKPEIEALAKRYIMQGYQRLLGFEVGGRSGSFSLYGQAPASTFLTAYGLLEFTDMAAVHAVDPALLERMRAFLKSKMKNDGSFEMDSYHAHGQAPLGIAASAYVVLALGESAPQKSIEYLRENLPRIQSDPYLCAMVSNALLKADRATASQLAGKLRGLANLDAAQARATLNARQTLAWGYGDTATIESSALGVMALIQTGEDMEFARHLLAGLQSYAGARGNWGSTHSTVLALRALELASSVGKNGGPSRVVVHVNGEPLAPIQLPAEETAVPVALPLNVASGKTKLRFQVEGNPLAVRAGGTAYVAWETAAAAPSNAGALSATVKYDSNTAVSGKSVLGTLIVTANRAAEVPMVEWGMAAGFTPNAEDLDALKKDRSISRWEISGRSLRLYLPDMPAAQKKAFSVRFNAASKGTLTARAGLVYEYYRKDEAAALAPAKFDVK